MNHTPESYRRWWSVLTHTPEREIYVPAALKEAPVFITPARCSNCGDEFEPVEYAPVPLDPDEPRFCSEDCAERFAAAEEASAAYGEARYGGAPARP